MKRIMKRAFKLIVLSIILAITHNIVIFSQAPDESYFEKNLPGQHHQLLHKFKGLWKMNFGILAGEESIYGSGIAENLIINTGRHIQMNLNFNAKGEQIKGLIIIGYNGFTEKYYFFGIDQISTPATYCVGYYNESTKQLIFEGENKEIDKDNPIHFKIVFSFVRDDKITYDRYSTINGKEVKTFESSLVRN